MNKLRLYTKIATAFFACSYLFQSCLKDTATKTYTLFSPVYKTMAEVRAGIKSNAPAPILKPGKIVLLGKYIFLNEIDKGIHVIDNSNPSAPLNKYFITIPGNLDLAIKGNTLYADLYSDLVTIDIADPAVVAIKKITKSVFPPRPYQSLVAGDTSTVIVDWIRKDTTVPVNDLPVYFPGVYIDSRNLALSSVPSPTVAVSGSTARFTMLGNYLYTVTETSLNIFDITQSEDPVFTSQKYLGWQVETISTFKGNLFIGSQSGVYIFSTSNPAQPTQLSVFAHATMCDPVIADDRYAYVTLHDGTACRGTLNELDIVDVSTIASPRFIKSYPLTNPHGLSKDGNTLFICDAAGGLKVFDATDINSLKLLQTVASIHAIDVIAINNNAIVVASDGLYQFDYSNIQKVTQRSKISYSL